MIQTMSTLIETVEEQYNKETAKSVAHFFNAVSLPVPQENEYTKTNDGSYLVFLNNHGCVIRMTPHSIKPFIHPRILQPLVIKKNKKLRMEIYPGVNAGVPPEDMRPLQKELRKDSIGFYDDIYENAAYLPYKKALGIPENYSVVIDMGAIDRLALSVGTVKDILRNTIKKFRDLPEKKSYQDILYAPLREAFEQAWPQDREPCPRKMQDFWNKCRKELDNGVLIVNWKNKAGNYKNARYGSQKYAESCENYCHINLSSHCT